MIIGMPVPGKDFKVSNPKSQEERKKELQVVVPFESF
jgi:hypothetical protein